MEGQLRNAAKPAKLTRRNSTGDGCVEPAGWADGRVLTVEMYLAVASKREEASLTQMMPLDEFMRKLFQEGYNKHSPGYI